MNTVLALSLLAVASATVTLAISYRLVGARSVGLRREAPYAQEDLEDQVAALRAMVLQLRLELAQSQRENQQSRVRDLELLRLRGAELVREAEVRSDRGTRQRNDAVPQEARAVLASLHELSLAE